MTKTSSVALAVLLSSLVVLSALTAVGCVDEDKEAWKKAETANSIEAYTAYLEERPNGKYAAQASDRIDELGWADAETVNSIEAYTAYLEERPNGKYAAQASERIDELDWEDAEASGSITGFQRYLREHPEGAHAEAANDNAAWLKATATNTIAGYQAYLSSHPSGRFTSDADERISALANDDTLFLKAQEVGTEEAYKGFLGAYPGHKREAEARARLDELAQDRQGRPVLDLIAQGKIEVKDVSSAGDSSAGLIAMMQVRSLVAHPLRAVIPQGTFFVATGRGHDVVATDDGSTIVQDQWLLLTVPVASTSINRRQLTSEGLLQIEPESPFPELKQVFPALRSASAPFLVRQAAVWIITDDASYASLGNLVILDCPQIGVPCKQTRAIDETTAAQGMKLLDDAGIDITSKTIWWDRNQILEGLTDEVLRNWLQQRAG